MRTPIILLLAITLSGLIAADASAEGVTPGSCLLYPFYSTQPDTMTIITVTNTGMKDVWIHVNWIDEEECTPSNQWIMLTARDTYTLSADAMVPPNERGFVYMYVVSQSGDDAEVADNVLIGQETVLGYWDNRLVHFSLNAATYQATQVNGDGVLDLDGSEYTAAPKTLYFPRFFGQNTFCQSKMILLHLLGGPTVNATAELMIYNDNEVAFSDIVTFSCWELKPLVDVSGATSNYFLNFTNHDPDEPHGFANVVETGFIKMTGVEAASPDQTLQYEEIGFYAVLLESITSFGYGSADLPMQAP